jgi:hypothetical protein
MFPSHPGEKCCEVFVHRSDLFVKDSGRNDGNDGRMVVPGTQLEFRLAQNARDGRIKATQVIEAGANEDWESLFTELFSP